MKTHHLDNVQLKALAWRVLTRHLGSSGALRFALLTQHGDGDYSQRRHKLLGSLSVDELVERMRGTPRRRSRRRARR